MAAVVNVEGIEFDDLIPYLYKNDHFICAIEYDDDGSGPNKESEKRVLKYLRELFNKLKSGECGDHYVIGGGLVQCLNEMGRVLITTYDECGEPDWNIFPITKNRLEEFFKKCN